MNTATELDLVVAGTEIGRAIAEIVFSTVHAEMVGPGRQAVAAKTFSEALLRYVRIASSAENWNSIKRLTAEKEAAEAHVSRLTEALRKIESVWNTYDDMALGAAIGNATDLLSSPPQEQK